MKERILAVVGAVALIAVAVVVRAVFLGGDDDEPGRRGSAGGGRPVVACTADLAPVCDALAAEGRIDADPPTLDLGDDAMADDAIDGWITWDPAPAIVELDREGTWDPAPTLLGGSTLAVAVRTGASVALPAGCSTGSLTWTCVVQAASDGLPVGVGPGTTSESLARLYPVAAALVPDDGDFRDVRANALRVVLDSPAVGQRDFPTQLRTLQTQPGALALLVGPADAFADAERLGSFAVEPSATVSVVLAARPGVDDLLADAFDDDAVADALRDAGVTPGSGTLADDVRAGDLFQVRDKVG